MAISNSIGIVPSGETISIQNNAVIECRLEYRVNDTQRDSTTKFALRAILSASSEAARATFVAKPAQELRGIQLSNAVTPTDVNSEWPGQLFVDTVVSPYFTAMLATQSSLVRVKRLKLTVTRGLNWVTSAGGGGLSSVSEARQNPYSGVATTLYSYKSGSRAKGLLSADVVVEHRSLAIDCYLRRVQDESNPDKPARFLVVGSGFPTIETAENSPAVEALLTRLETPVRPLIIDGTDSGFAFMPVFFASNRWRPVVITQLEGIRDLAGEKIRRRLNVRNEGGLE